MVAVKYMSVDKSLVLLVVSLLVGAINVGSLLALLLDDLLGGLLLISSNSSSIRVAVNILCIEPPQTTPHLPTDGDERADSTSLLLIC